MLLPSRRRIKGKELQLEFVSHSMDLIGACGHELSIRLHSISNIIIHYKCQIENGLVVNLSRRNVRSIRMVPIFKLIYLLFILVIFACFILKCFCHRQSLFIVRLLSVVGHCEKLFLSMRQRFHYSQGFFFTNYLVFYCIAFFFK